MLSMNDHCTLVVVKGNLRHRIDKLGMEKSAALLTYSQLRLRAAAETMGFHGDYPERPTWAHGAFVYLTEVHALGIQEIIEAHGTMLKSKHILVSNSLMETLKEVLDAQPEGEGRELYQIRRAGEISREEVIDMNFPSYSWKTLNKLKKGIDSGINTDDDRNETAAVTSIETVSNGRPHISYGCNGCDDVSAESNERCVSWPRDKWQQSSWSSFDDVWQSYSCWYHNSSVWPRDEWQESSWSSLDDVWQSYPWWCHKYSERDPTWKNTWWSTENDFWPSYNSPERDFTWRKTWWSAESSKSVSSACDRRIYGGSSFVDTIPRRPNSQQNIQSTSQTGEWKPRLHHELGIGISTGSASPNRIYVQKEARANSGQSSYINVGSLLPSSSPPSPLRHTSRNTIGNQSNAAIHAITNRPDTAVTLPIVKEMLSPWKGQIYLLKLNTDLMSKCDIDQELLEFLVSPPSVQKLSPELWIDAWSHVVRRNATWLEMRLDACAGECPYCTLCKKWANIDHLLSLQCETNRSNKQIEELLTAILNAEKQDRLRRLPSASECQ